MHEISLVRNIVEIAEKEAIKAHATSIRSIWLKIGECAGVEQDAFEFAWSAVVQHTMLENASKVIETVVGKATCMDCDEKFTVHGLYDACPKCGSYLKEVYQGKEFFVKSLTVI